VPLSPVAARDIAVDVGTRAGELLKRGWGHAGEVRNKGLATDLVTEWDTRLEELIKRELAVLAPGVPVLGEELGLSAPDAGDGMWVVDPVDGTVNFAHALPLFGISIAYEIDGVAQAGVVVAPALGWTFAAARGHGATMNGAPISVSQTDVLQRAMVVTGFAYDTAFTARNNMEAWAHMHRVAGGVRRLGAASLDLCFVACGWMDGYWEFNLRAWDLAAGALVVEEAGGKVTALDGGPFRSASGEVLATNGKIHDELRRELHGKV
jgi:myo-inositol-1(or 4)-monophosphatase